MILRECSCGTVALTEEDLELFEVDSRSKHGRRNRCKKCAADKTRKDKPLKERGVRCARCKTLYNNSEAYREFRRAKPTGDLIAGHLLKICKHCENKEGFIEIDGKLVKSNINEIYKASRITHKPQEAI